jgi:hypothetical protein
LIGSGWNRLESLITRNFTVNYLPPTPGHSPPPFFRSRFCRGSIPSWDIVTTSSPYRRHQHNHHHHHQHQTYSLLLTVYSILSTSYSISQFRTRRSVTHLPPCPFTFPASFRPLPIRPQVSTWKIFKRVIWNKTEPKWKHDKHESWVVERGPSCGPVSFLILARWASNWVPLATKAGLQRSVGWGAFLHLAIQTSHGGPRRFWPLNRVWSRWQTQILLLVIVIVISQSPWNGAFYTRYSHHFVSLQALWW